MNCCCYVSYFIFLLLSLVLPTAKNPVIWFVSMNSMTKIFSIKRIVPTCNILWKRPSCYYWANKTRVTDNIFKLMPIYTSVVYQWPRIRWGKVLLSYFRLQLDPDIICRRGLLTDIMTTPYLLQSKNKDGWSIAAIKYDNKIFLLRTNKPDETWGTTEERQLSTYMGQQIWTIC